MIVLVLLAKFGTSKCQHKKMMCSVFSCWKGGHFLIFFTSYVSELDFLIVGPIRWGVPGVGSLYMEVSPLVVSPGRLIDG